MLKKFNMRIFLSKEEFRKNRRISKKAQQKCYENVILGKKEGKADFP